MEKYEISPEAYERRQSTCMGGAGRGLWGRQSGPSQARWWDSAWRAEEGEAGLRAGTDTDWERRGKEDVSGAVWHLELGI